jgi:hypothetical protein
MSAVPDNIVPFAMPKKPRIKEKDAPPDQRKVCILPIRAVFDKQMTHGALQALAALCAYCNRAGITWVSQTRLASDLGISQQAVAKQFKQLRELGYLETVRKGFKGERTDTLRVVFDPTISAEDAIAMTSNKEDTRPPAIREEQERQASQQIDREGQAKIAKLISQALKQPPKKEYSMPNKGDTRAVKQVKEAMAKTRAKRSRPVDKPVDNHQSIHNSQVVNEEAVHSQPNHNLEVVLISEEHIRDKELKVNIKQVVKELNTVLYNLEVSDFDSLIDSGMKPEQIADSLNTLLPLYRAEGIEPTSSVLADGIRQLQADAR